MTRQEICLLVPLCAVIALTCACSNQSPHATSTTSPSAMDKLMASTERAAEAADDAQPASDALKPGERLQGTIQLDIGDGAAPFRSLATKIPDDLGKTTAARLASAEGKKDLAGANDKVGGGRVNVSAQDVQDMADAFAGRTTYTSQMYSIAIIKQRQVELAGIAADGRRTTLTISFPLDSDTPKSARLEYTPNGKKRMQSFESKRKSDDSVQVTLDRFERVDDDTVSLAGSFKADKLSPTVLARDLAGQEIASASGSFDFSEIHVRADM